MYGCKTLQKTVICKYTSNVLGYNDNVPLHAVILIFNNCFLLH